MEATRLTAESVAGALRGKESAGSPKQANMQDTFAALGVPDEEQRPRLSTAGNPQQDRGPDGEAVRIVGGQTVFVDSDGTQRYPGYVQLRKVVRNVLGRDASSFVCGGAVVHAWTRTEARLAGFWVATAAHCLDSDEEYQVALWSPAQTPEAGRPVALAPTTRMDASSSTLGPWRLLGPQGILAFRHPLYGTQGTGSGEHLHDIALLRVVLPPGDDLPETLLAGGSGPPAQKTPAWDRIPQLARQRPVRNAEATILGFGLTEAPTKSELPASVSPTLQRLRVAVEPTSFPWRASDEDARMFLWVVGVPTLLGQKVTTACNGDSGGPLLVEPAEAAAAAAAPPTLAGVLCCGYCKTVERREDLLRYPSLYTRVDAFVGPAEGDAAELLKADSVWQHGLEGIMARYSPTLYRTATPSPLAPASVAAPEEAWADGGMAWVEGPGRRDLAPTYLRAALRIAIIVLVATAVAALAVVPLRAAFARRGGAAAAAAAGGAGRTGRRGRRAN
jgi:hypothetical protein